MLGPSTSDRKPPRLGGLALQGNDCSGLGLRCWGPRRPGVALEGSGLGHLSHIIFILGWPEGCAAPGTPGSEKLTQSWVLAGCCPRLLCDLPLPLWAWSLCPSSAVTQVLPRAWHSTILPLLLPNLLCGGTEQWEKAQAQGLHPASSVTQPGLFRCT